jgi:phosphatidylinositol glycan class B
MTLPPTPKLRTPWVEVTLAALPAALHALLLLGRLHPDELFQSLEIALHRAYGFGVLPWEWQVPPDAGAAGQPWGIRNHAVPMLFAALFKLGDALGLSSPMARRTLVELPQLALHAAMLGAVWRLVARRVNAQFARAALWLVALYGPLVWFAGRTMSESFSTAFLAWGLERLDARDERPQAWALGGMLLGFAQVTRYGSAAVIVPAMAWLLVERRWRTFAFGTAGGLAVAFGLGLLDKLTWGEWFHSFIHYVRFNVLSGQAAAQFGAQPWWQYLPRLLLAPFAVVGLALSFKRGSTARVPLFLAAAVGYVVILSATAHKEDRFLYPALVLLTVAGAPGFVQWLQAGWGSASRQRAGALLAAAGLAFFVFPSPYDVQRKEQFQLTVKAARGATGFVLMNEGMWGSPGFFYLGAQIPWCPCDFPQDGCFQMAGRDGRFNRGVYWSNGSEAERPRDAQSIAAFQQAGFRLVEQRGQAYLFER